MTKTTNPPSFPSQLTQACEKIHSSRCEELYHVSFQITFTSLQLTTELGRKCIKFRFQLTQLFSWILCFEEKNLIGNNFCDTLSLLVYFSYGCQHPWRVKTKFSQAIVGDFQLWKKETFRHHSTIYTENIHSINIQNIPFTTHLTVHIPIPQHPLQHEHQHSNCNSSILDDKIPQIPR